MVPDCKTDYMLMNKINRLKKNIIYNPGHNILELYCVLVQVRFATNKTKMISSITNLVYELPHELLNLGIVERSQIRMET